MDYSKFALIVVLISAGVFAVSFWILMLKDCVKEMEGYERYKWIMIMILTNILGAAAYYLLPRRKRIKERGY